MTLPRPALPRHHRAQVNFSGTVGDVRFEEPGDPATVLRVLYLVFNEGYTGDVDLAAEAIRLMGELASMTDDEETAGLLALILLHHGRRPARTRRDGSLVPLAGRTAPAGTPRSSPRASQSCRQRWAATDSVTSKPRPLSPPCTPTRRAPRRPTGCRSSAGRTSCSGSPTARSCSSTGPSPSARPMAPWPASRPRRPWTLPCPATPPPRRTSTRRRATLGPRHGCTPTPPGPPPTSPSVTTSPAGSADQSSAARTSPLVNRSHKAKPATGTAQADEVSPRVVSQDSEDVLGPARWV